MVSRSVVACFVCFFGGALGISHQSITNLKNILFKDYDELVPPILTDKTGVDVRFGASVINLRLDELKGEAIWHLWYRAVWEDERLRWEPSEHDNITELRVPSDRVWLPDITAYNEASEDEFRSALHQQHAFHVVVYSRGEVLFVPSITMKTYCQDDLVDWPFDAHECSIKFGSWVYHGFLLDLNLYSATGNSFELDNYRESPHWEIVEKPTMVRHETIYSCCEEPYVDLMATVTLMRRPSLFYKGTLFFPVIGTALLTLCALWLPAGSTHRLMYFFLNSILLLILQLYHSSFIPITSEKSIKIMNCMNVLLCLQVLGLLWSLATLLLACSHNGFTSKLVQWGRGILGRIFCLPAETPEKLLDEEEQGRVWKEILVERPVFPFLKKSDSNLISAGGAVGISHQSATNLKNNLFEDYDALVPPIPTDKTGVDVRFGVALINLRLDELKGEAIWHLWKRAVWEDERLMWEPSEYDNITVLRVPSNQVWLPDITAFNEASEDEFRTALHQQKGHVLVYSSGEVLFVPSVCMKTYCQDDLAHWPFDAHECNIKFGSWVYHGILLNLSLYNGKENVDLLDYRESPHWEIVGNSTMVRHDTIYDCCVEPYVDLTVTVMLMRRPSLFYRTTLFFPIVGAALLTLCALWLPAGSTHRLMYFFLNSILLLILQLYHSSFIPITSEKSIKIMNCMNVLLCLQVLGLLWSQATLLLACSHNGFTSKLVQWGRGILGCIFCLPTENPEKVGTSALSVAGCAKVMTLDSMAAAGGQGARPSMEGDPSGAVNISHQSTTKLKNILFQDYDELVPPFSTDGKAVHVRFGLDVLHLRLDDLKGEAIWHLWYQARWQDKRLQWKPWEHAFITDIRISPDQVWLPDITAFNEATEDEFRSSLHQQRSSNVVVYSTGEVWFVPSVIINTYCQDDLAHWPLDAHECRIKFGSWVYHGFLLNLSLIHGDDSFDLRNYQESPHWEIVGKPTMVRQDTFYKCCAEPYLDLTASVKLMRRPSLFYKGTLFFPVVGTALLTLCALWLPAGSTHRLMYFFLNSILLLILQLYHSSFIPISSEKTIKIMNCMNVLLCLQVLGLLWSLATLLLARFHNGFTSKLVQWGRGILGRIFCLPTETPEKVGTFAQSVSRCARVMALDSVAGARRGSGPRVEGDPDRAFFGQYRLLRLSFHYRP
ncbi:unnamed protein product [Darwinula stevensoni]|uniref:Neurotransmitter-gated ion-channel ligand-binding domain-containing protein n=1 Tax=Darwinula stevensoni TaxID=69355 RepID=A0A7R8X9E2_9CRUS|nr:unnamed protein product [Darwinula stevensoni]CAG0890558.1 unnamed protein product [Darwinula stevensoni]